MPRTVAASGLDEGLAGFRAEVVRLALALVEQVLADEVARWQAARATVGRAAQRRGRAPTRRRTMRPR